MNNTKTIFKSLLIMIVAISLFTVSCSKDEGGTKTPTNPKIQTISAEDITTTITQLGELKDTGGSTVILNLGGINPQNGNAAITGADASFNKVKEALGNVTKVQWTGVTVTTDLDSQQKPNTRDTLKVKITFTANSGFEFDTTITDGTKYAYDKGTKEANLTLSITPSADWQQ